jgi:hypothetical protein
MGKVVIDPQTRLDAIDNIHDPALCVVYLNDNGLDYAEIVIHLIERYIVLVHDKKK